MSLDVFAFQDVTFMDDSFPVELSSDMDLFFCHG